MTTPIIRPRNWHEFQHYHDRKPVWIKLHRSLLSDSIWQMLSGDQPKAFIGLLLQIDFGPGEFGDSVR